jgi:tetratricopeptide (TPR) repeat protein/DNA-binding CsgD family transcriptional regulator
MFKDTYPLLRTLHNIKTSLIKKSGFTLLMVLLNLCYAFADTNQVSSEILIKKLPKLTGKEKVETLMQLSGNHLYSDTRIALNYTQEALSIAIKLQDNDLAARCMIQQGLAYTNMGSYDTAKIILNNALKLQSWSAESIVLARLYTVLGIAHEKAGLSDSALRCYNKAFVIYQASKNHQGISNSYLNIGCLFSRLKKYDEASSYLQKALNESVTHDVQSNLGSIYNNLGVVCDIRGRKKEALNYYSKALKIQDDQGNRAGMATIYHNMGMIHNDLGEYTLALSSIQKSLNLKLEAGNREGTANAYSLMSEVLINLNRISEAEEYSLKALRMATEGRYLIVEAGARKQLAGIYYTQKRFAESSIEWEKALIINDSLYNQSVSQKLSDMQSHYELKHKEQENQILKQQISLQLARETQQRNYFRFLMFGIIAISIVLILLFVLFRMKVLSMRRAKELHDKEYRLKELELAAKENDYRLLEMEKEREAAKKALLVQQYEAEQEIRNLEMKNLNTSIELKNKELTTLSANFISKNELLGLIKRSLINLRRYFKEGTPDDLNEMISLVNSNLDHDLNWKKFKISFDQTHTGFLDNLIKIVPDLSLTEQKLCAYLFIGLSSTEIASVMNISLAAVNKSRQRMRKRLGLQPNADICSYLHVLHENAGQFLMPAGFDS